MHAVLRSGSLSLVLQLLLVPG